MGGGVDRDLGSQQRVERGAIDPEEQAQYDDHGQGGAGRHQLGPVPRPPSPPRRFGAAGPGIAAAPVLEEEVHPPTQQDGQGEVDQQQVAIEEPLAVDPREEEEEPAERRLGAEGREQADGQHHVPDPPLSCLGSSTPLAHQQRAGGDQGQDPRVAGHLLEVVRPHVPGLAVVGAEEEGGGDQGDQPGRQ